MKFACIQSETKVNVGKSTCANGQNIVAPAGHTQLVDFAQSDPRIELLPYNKYFISLTREANLGNSLSVVQWKLLPSGP